MNFPLDLSFKIVAISPQVTARDASGNVVLYTKQKAFKLKEAVTVFADVEQTRPLYTINADRVLDFNAKYNIADASGRRLGAVARKGRKSLWRAEYEVLDGGGPPMTIREENGWVKVGDALFGEIPVVGIFSGYLFNPSYVITGAAGAPLMRLSKQPAFLEGRFRVEKLAEMSPADETRAVLAFLMMVLLERRRG
ncbi:MAG TPA: hypothetical protein VF570_12785 [Pyrinomonadaceae bacterium]